MMQPVRATPPVLPVKPQPSYRVAVFAILAVAIAAFVFAGWFAFTRFGAAAGTDVGENKSLRAVQKRFAAGVGCQMTYRTHHRDKHDQVLLLPCDPKESFPTPARLPVDPADFRDVAFDMRRDREGERWHVTVDTARVPLDKLLAALEALAPVYERDGARLLTAASARDAEGASKAREQEKDAEKARDRSRRSYDE